MIALWDTTVAEVLRTLSAERRNAGNVVRGVALTLISVVPDPSLIPSAQEACATAASLHPCRVIIVTRNTGPNSTSSTPSRLDADILVGGSFGLVEAVVLRIHGQLANHADSVVLPLLTPGVPVVTWWHGPPPDFIATDPLGVIAQRRITDVAQAPDPVAALRHRAQDFAPGDTDLAWSRLTPWRSLLANAFDNLSQRVVSATVVAAPANPSGALLRGWLQACLQLEPVAVDGRAGIEAVMFGLADGHEITIERTESGARLRLPGRVETAALPERNLGELIAEELRISGIDTTYVAALEATTGQTGLLDRRPTRSLVWFTGSPQQELESPPTSILISDTPQDLAASVAARLLRHLSAVLRRRGKASVVLTGGRIAERICRALRENPDRHAINWEEVDVWWGDERFLPAGSADRNDTMADSVLLSSLPLDPGRIHRMPASDGPYGSDLDMAAASYAEALADAAANEPGPDPRVPWFDVLLLSIGEDGHVASVFPNHPSAAKRGVVAGVRNSPKPPPNRITLTISALNTAREVWIIGAGEEKAEAVRKTLTGCSSLPAALVRGVERTIWLLDKAAAAGLLSSMQENV